MNKRTIHIIGNEFTRDFYREDLNAWWTYRLGIYENYCLASIKNQTNKNFVLFMMLKGYSTNFKDKIEQMLIDSKLKYVIQIIGETSIEEALKQYLDNIDVVYHTRIDSDDMFHYDVVNEIQSYEYEERRALLFSKGYCYDCRRNKLQHYYMPAPPFSTIMYPIETYLDEEKQDEYKGFKSHDAIGSTMKLIRLSENKFIVNVHDTNRITIYHDDRTIFKGHESETEIPADQVDNILNDFGISSMTYKLKMQQ